MCRFPVSLLLFGGFCRGAGKEIIPARKFHQIRMNSGEGNHLCERIPSNQDAFGRRESSLGENSIKSGCIWSAKIIPERKFHQIRMHSAVGNHPCEKVSSNQDEFRRRKSSLGGNFIKSGCIRAEKIIPERKFHQIRMHSGGGKLWNCGNAKKTLRKH